MSKPLKPPVIIAIAVIALLILVFAGYKTTVATNAPERTDAAHLQVIAAMKAARAASHKGSAPPHP